MFDKFSSEFEYILNYCLNGEIIAEAHTAYSTLHRLMVYFRYFRRKMRNMEAHAWPKKIIVVYSSTKENKLTICKPCITQNPEIANNGHFRGYKTYSCGTLNSPTMMTSHGGSATVPRQIRRMLAVCVRTPAIDRDLIEYVAILLK